MAKGIKKFDQEIRVVSSILSMNNVSSGFTGDLSSNSANTNGAFYVNSDAPWFANETNTYELASNVQVTTNTTDIATLSARTFENGLTNSGNVVKLGGTLTNNTTINGDTSYSFTVDDITALNMIVDTDSYLSLAPNSFNIFSANLVGITGSDTQVEIQAAGNDHILITGTGVELGDQTGTYILVENANGIKIDGADNNVSVTTDGIATFGSTTNNLYFDPTNNAVQMNVDGSTFTIDGGTPGTFIGFEYIDDYSAQFTDNSLITKLYVDSAITSIPASDNYYLTGVTISNGVLTYDLANTTSSVTFDITDQLTLDMLSGVTINTGTLEDGDFLIWNSGTAQWEASGLTEDSLIAGDGINFDTGVTGQVTINSILAGTGGTWIASDGSNSTHVEYTDTVVIQGSGDVSVTLVTGATTQTYTISNSSTANVDSVSATSGLTTFGNTTGDVIVGHVNNYGTVNIDTSGVEVIDTLLTDTYGHVTGATKRSITGVELDTALQHRYVSISGDTMTGELIINVGSGNQALTTQGDVTINGDLYVSGTTVTVDAENLAITDNIIVVNSGQTGNGVSRGTAGIMVDRGDFTEYVFIFDENSDTFRIGETSSSVDDNIISTGFTQAVATREDNPNSYGIAYWNSGATRFNTTAEPTNSDDGYVLSWNSGNSAWEYVDIQSTISGVYSWSTIYTDGSSISTTSTNDTFTIAGGSGLTTNGSSSTITIDHDVVTVSTTNLGSNKIITNVTTDSTGHITDFTTSDVDFSSLQYYKTFTTDSGGPVAASSTDDTIAIVGGNMIETVGSTDTITFNHETISNTNISLGDNEYINGLTFDAYGHITATSTAKTELFISGDTGTSVDALLNNGIYISGGTGISTEMDGNTLVINSETSELQYNETLGGTSTTLTDPDFTGAKVVIIDYIINSGNAGSEQEGQLRYLVTSDTITNDYQGDLDISFSDASLSGTDLILTHDSSTYSFDYVVKLIL